MKRQNKYFRQARTPDPRNQGNSPHIRGQGDFPKLNLTPCKFWKLGKCDWGWSCRFLHGDSVDEDPRRPEYTGPPIDFTQFPRPVVSSPHYNAQSPLHAEDQSRVKPFRNPVVEIILANTTFKSQFSRIRDTLSSSCIDTLSSTDMFLNAEQAKARMEEDQSDYILFVDQSGYTIIPDYIQCPLQNVAQIINLNWAAKCNNFTLEQLELLTNHELEQVILRIAPDSLDNIEETILNLQNSTADAIASSTTATCAVNTKDVMEIKRKLQEFFSQLNLVNTIIADMPIYLNAEPQKGKIVQVKPPPPGGLSSSTQKVLSFIMGRSLSQIHMCIHHINKLLGCVTPAKTVFASPDIKSAGLHPTPLSASLCSAICGEETAPRVEFGRRLEPEVTVDTPTQYTISFRSSMNTGYPPFEYGLQ
ncbi:hypothetical protein TVAG_033270 [Trichomonas vaginalis G3]|uniref:C3H1-type domain-containing protein n=1 Tax=Trichomonas vaginalis (strain ATCC PRA-98 / G3) TaxID=412133 RepID=A2FIZ2_TRIV3|nr:CCCH zinc finger family [Trichomonas vaginalis G3]EAX95107.1 hypothetical protein TVAG_033270 [Trichomonas vaginalis G3]KAI5524597.1 CCCH zinc finger family [Trichomonas vaginalis G3]|eukprot:XP_001308037.1 hypothetical protein [Trichomonas vaginalis G3]